jgi:exopolysaccharide production protein ExoQ
MKGGSHIDMAMINDSGRTRSWSDSNVGIANTLSYGPRHMHALAITWILLFPLLVFASQYGFSFEHGSVNTLAGSASMSGPSEEDNTVLRLQSLVIYLTCALCIAPYTRKIVSQLIRNPLIASLPILAAVSSFWSQQPQHTVIASIYLGVDICFVAYLLRRFSAQDLMKVLLIVGSVAAIGSLILIVVLPKYGIENRSTDAFAGAWQGIFGQKNVLGQEMTYLLMPVFFVKIYGRWGQSFRFAYVVLALLLIGFSRSTGSWMLCVAGIASFAAMRVISRVSGTTAAFLTSMGVAFTGMVVTVLQQGSDVFLRLIGKDPTMTGRTMIWGSLVLSFLKSPFLGYGYEGFWNGLHGESANVSLTMNYPGLHYAENGLLDLALNLGLVGVIIYLAIYLLAIRDAFYCFRRNPSNAVMWYISILVLVGVSNLTAGFILFRSNLQCMLPLLAYMGLRHEAKRIRFGQSA